jgi:hypothetical protein
LLPSSEPSSEPSSLIATRKLIITINAYLISPNTSNIPKPAYKPIIKINSFNTDNNYHTSYNENDTNDFYENNNNTSYASLSSLFEDSLNVTDFLNSLNANNHTTNANNRIDGDDEDDELINTILQHMALKEQQRFEKEAEKGIENSEDGKKVKNISFDPRIIQADNNNTTVNKNIKNVKASKPPKVRLNNIGKGSNSKLSKHKSLVSRIDPVPDANSHQSSIPVFVNTQLLSNPNIVYPNQVDYLFRLPLSNPNPDPILIIKK